MMNHETYHMYPIGYIRRTHQDIHLEILGTFRPALKQRDQFNHMLNSLA